MSEIKLGDAIRAFLKQSKMSDGVQTARLKMHWENIAGKAVAKYTDKIEIKNKTLYIHTDVAPLKQELMFQKPLLLTRVNEQLGEEVVKELVLL
jgi:predicted nucleic acid-binding Zn ribbon protein